MVIGLTGDELQLNYTDWCKLITERRKDMTPDLRRWLGAWQVLDLHMSPMDDTARRQIRYGHYLGWLGAKATPAKPEHASKYVIEQHAKELARIAALPPGTCPACEGEGEQGGQFCGGFWTCEACGGSGKAPT